MIFIAVGMLAPLSAVAQSVQSIAVVRQLDEGTQVHVEGVILNAPNEEDLRFIQDSTGGIAIYTPDPVFHQNVRRGDAITIRARVDEYQGLIELTNVIDYSIQGSAQLPDIKDFQSNAVEFLLGQRVNLSCLSDRDHQLYGEWEAGKYPLERKNDPINFWVPQGSDFIGKSRSRAVIHSEGILYRDRSGLRFLAQKIIDQSDGECLTWLQSPSKSNAGQDFIEMKAVVSSSNYQGHVIANAPDGVVDTTWINGTDTIVAFLDGLEPATIYNLQWHLSNTGDTLELPSQRVVTQSLSSKNIRVFFNNSIRDTSLRVRWPYSVDGVDLVEEIVERIDGAKFQVNLASYNFNNSSIRQALDRAHDRGVEVRVIADSDNGNFGLFSTDFPVFRTASGSPLMHHKFIVIDPQQAERSWVLMGATNFTRNQLYEDPNSSIGFEDQMLARVYLKEFEELWGGEEATYNPGDARQGDLKKDDTPHEMFYGTMYMESYFSPSDGTTAAIIEALKEAESEVYFSLLTFTQNDIRDAILELYEKGVNIYGVIQNIDDNGGEFYNLRNAGLSVYAAGEGNIHHHKYAIIDPGKETAQLIFGSHNWTQKAEDTNDENTLILHDRGLSTLFLEEFWGRLCEINPSHENCPVEEEEVSAMNSMQVAPNPGMSDEMYLFFEGDEPIDGRLLVYNINGVEVSNREREIREGANPLTSLHQLPAGVYFLQWRSDQLEWHGRVIIGR